MNIGAISNNTFKANFDNKGYNLPPAEDYTKYIRFTGEIDDYVRQTVDENWSVIGESAKKHGTTLNLAQRNDELLVNAGPLTTSFRMSKLAGVGEFLDKILNNIRYNYKIMTKELTMNQVMSSIYKDCSGNFKKIRTLVK